MKYAILRLAVFVCVTMVISFALTACKKEEASAVPCAPLSIVIDRGNTVYGLKEGRIFAYVDLAEITPALACHSDTEISDALASAVTAAVSDWWKEPRLLSASKAEVHIISILDKDEYARSNFNAAMTHGKLEFERNGSEVKILPATLTFDNMRAKVNEKK